MIKDLKQILKDPIKLLIWVYLALLITEGALRKWILPGLSNPLLIVRDPVVVLIYLLAFSRYNRAFTNGFSFAILGISAAGTVTALLFGHHNMFVSIFGFRTFWLHIPLIWVMGYCMNKEDIVLMGKCLLLLSIPMTLLIVAQFSSPQTSFVNKAPGGVAGGGFSGALGKFRPGGTFSFITGVVQFYTLTAAFLFSSLFEKKYFPMLVIITCGVSIGIAVPVSISRSLFINLIIVALFATWGVYRAGLKGGNLLRVLFIGLIGVWVVMQFNIFGEGMEAFTARWDAATGEARGGVEKAIFGRVYDETIAPLFFLDRFGIFGQGIGLGTQVGATIMTGDQMFLAGEGEWQRMLMELGFVLGPILLITRIAFATKIGLLAHKLLQHKNLLPWLLFSSAGMLMVNGQWGQPTTLGFSAMSMGMCLAACKSTKSKKPAKKKKSVRIIQNSGQSNSGEKRQKPPPPVPGKKGSLPPLK